jgi:hypothetical protein
VEAVEEAEAVTEEDPEEETTEETKSISNQLERVPQNLYALLPIHVVC